MTVPDIVEQILKENGISDFQFRAPLRDASRYPEREYCVQYRESSLNFISRLLEEEGIFYYFEHTATKHTMIFADNSSVLGTCPGQAIAQYAFGQRWLGLEQRGRRCRSGADRGGAHGQESFSPITISKQPSLNLQRHARRGQRGGFRLSRRVHNSEGRRALRASPAGGAGSGAVRRQRLQPLPRFPAGLQLQTEGTLSPRYQPGLLSDLGLSRCDGFHLPAGQ